MQVPINLRNKNIRQMVDVEQTFARHPDIYAGDTLYSMVGHNGNP